MQRRRIVVRKYVEKSVRSPSGSEFIREGARTFDEYLSDVLTRSRMNSLPQDQRRAVIDRGNAVFVGAAEGCESGMSDTAIRSLRQLLQVCWPIR
jgi:hypothetical protein